MDMNMDMFVYAHIVTNSEFRKWNTVESRGTPPNFFRNSEELRGI